MPLPKGQSWLITRMQKLGYASDNAGVCYGIAHMAMQAILSDEIDAFDKRLELINRIPVEIISDEISDLHKKRKINKNLPIDRVLEIPAFFEGVELYQKAYRYPSLFEKPPTSQSANPVIPFVTPQQFKEKNIEIVNCSDFIRNEAKLKNQELPFFTGIYTNDELVLYFQSLREAVQKNKEFLNKPFTLVLDCSNHSITVAYDPRTDQWLFVNPSELPTKHIAGKDENAIAENVLASLSETNITSFSSKIYSTSDNLDAIKQCVAEWQQNKNWQKIHEVSSSKVKMVDSDGASWLYIAARNNELEIVKKLLAENEVDIESKKKGGLTALLVAAERGHLEVVNELLANKANIHHANNYGNTALHKAAQNGHPEVVIALLNAKGNINQLNSDGFTPLMVAAENGHLKVVQSLLKRTTNLDQQANNGLTPIMIAAENGYLDIVKEILAAKKDRNLTDDNNAEALYLAAKNGHVEIVKTLLVEMPEQSTKTQTPVYIAAQNGDFDTLRLLVSQGAKINTPFVINKFKLLEFAISKEISFQVLPFIDKKPSGENISITAEEIATLLEYTEIVDYLNYQNELLKSDVNPSRHQALQKLLNEENFKEIVIQFKKLDEITLNLMNIKNTYKSETVLHEKNETREKSVLNLIQLSEKAYQDFIKGDDIDKIIKQLIEDVNKISTDTKIDHKKQAPVISLFFTSSRLAKQIDHVVSSYTNKNKKF